VNIYTHANVRQLERAGDVLAEAILSTQMTTKMVVVVHQKGKRVRNALLTQ
jgi:hypothetical protein